VLGTPVDQVMPLDGFEGAPSIWSEVAEGRIFSGRVEIPLPDGSVRVAELTASPMWDEDNVVNIVGELTLDAATDWVSVSERTSLGRQGSEVHLGIAFRNSQMGLAVADLDGHTTVVNPGLSEILGRPARELIGHRWSDFLHPDDASLGRASLAGRPQLGRVEQRILRPTGDVVWVDSETSLVTDIDDEPAYLVTLVRDVTARKVYEQALERRSLFDDLTGLANRPLLLDRLDHALARAERSSMRVGVALLDIDGFRHVNEAFGRAVGDRLLIELSQRLSACLRPVDTVARLGHDQFAVVCDNVTAEVMAALAARIEGQMSGLFDLDGSKVGLSVSLGVTVSVSGSSSRSLLSEAAAAMRRAKMLGTGSSSFYDDSLRARAVVTAAGEGMLRTGIAHREIVAYYQPVIDLRTGQPVGVEALARWLSADLGIVPPSAFVPLAEASGLIQQIGEDILNQATADVAKWNVGRTKPLWVSVNLSATQLNDQGLPDLVGRALRQSGLPASLLQLEIAESAMMADAARSVVALRQLKEIGVAISIDDFGTGYSSIPYLHELPVDTLKIDRSFVKDFGDRDGDTATVSAILALARAMKMRCLAEGVETAQQSTVLTNMGCHLAQGYLWSEPLAPADAAGWAQGLDS
jgi:diguanylate cyclase (GGDEF)-like protein/PAS domain S-box-containing protein